MAMFFASKAHGAGALSERIQQMKFNSKVTWGLAWAGLAVVLAVPSVDFLTGKLGTASSAAVADVTAAADATTPASAIRPI